MSPAFDESRRVMLRLMGAGQQCLCFPFVIWGERIHLAFTIPFRICNKGTVQQVEITKLQCFAD